MTKKNVVEKLKQDMPESLTELEKARYVYIELGKLKAFDTRYFYGNKKTRDKIYRLSEQAKHNPHAFDNRRTITCVSLSYLYKSILKELGIDCRVILDGELKDGHVTPIIELSDGRRIKADLQLDLPNIQTGLETREFGSSFSGFHCDLLDREELKEIDRKIGYIEEDYKDKDLEELEKEIEEMNATDTLKMILQSPKIYSGTRLQGHVERRRYYSDVLSRLAKKHMNKKIYLFTCYRERENANNPEDPKRDYTLCAYSYEKERATAYLYSRKTESFLPISIEQLAELEDEGLVFGASPRSNGAQLLKKIVAKQKNVRQSIDKTR